MEKILMIDRSPIVSEFETEELEANYTAWLRAKVEASLADSRPAIPHDEVERRMAERLARLRHRRAS
ncbi:stability determinant [Pseudomonas amygdali pv. morsprunorum]|nr:stability determinant [Pseudomonas syringae pv. maculicola]KOP58600.1 stability determinant [Pseudomonas coronafaciens pv. porri]KPW06381.1 Stability determinant [Pseudomonas amygdali pv. aesculi]KPW49491.1 Stability determinant [Pseudomonas syringae pv. berberidis]KPW54395.1 Stability determinant [Pseudomonas syringae pv. broussonetiae]KPW74538.1 Stability determinant [Pseudomonas amygdali pv. ciccaronei]KPX09946.1 Stability determinant [Pseudomonas syringae pv. cunninghamiae]KPX45386.1 